MGGETSNRAQERLCALPEDGSFRSAGHSWLPANSPTELSRFRPFNGSWPLLGHTGCLLTVAHGLFWEASFQEKPLRRFRQRSFLTCSSLFEKQVGSMLQIWP